MRIGIDAQFAAYQIRGIGKYILHLVSGLPVAGPHHEYVVYGPPSMFPTVAALPNVRFRSPGSLPYPLWEQCVLPLWARQDRLDVLHCPANTFPLLLSSHTKLVVTVHDVMYLLPPDVMPKTTVRRQQLGNLYRRYIVPRVPRRACAILTVSEFSKSEIVRVLGAEREKVHVAHNGVECLEQEEDAPEPPRCFGQRTLSGPYILTLGAHDPRKNTEMVLRAFAEVRKRLTGREKLVIAGLKQWRTSRFWALTRELDIQDDVFFADYVSAQDLHRLYQSARAFLFLSKFEGFGLPVIEAMARGVPIIASNTSCIPEIMGDAGVTVDPDSMQEICDATALVLGDANLRQRLAERGKARAAEFSWDKLVRATLAVYENAFSVPYSVVPTAPKASAFRL